MGGDSKGSRKYRSNGTGPGRNVKGGGAVGVTILNRELGGDQGDAQGPDGVSTLGGATDHGDESEIWGRRRVGVSSGRGGNGISGDPPNWNIN